MNNLTKSRVDLVKFLERYTITDFMDTLRIEYYKKVAKPGSPVTVKINNIVFTLTHP